jgi:hypothetical protein
MLAMATPGKRDTGKRDKFIFCEEFNSTKQISLFCSDALLLAVQKNLSLTN